MTTKPVWNQILTWQGTPSPHTISLGVKHYTENKHSKSLGEAKHVFAHSPLGCTILFQNLSVENKKDKDNSNGHQAAVQLKMLWLPGLDQALFDDVWNALIPLVHTVNSGDRKKLDHVYDLHIYIYIYPASLINTSSVFKWM